MKKILTALISAAFIALPLAVVSTPAAAKTSTAKKHKKAKAHKAKSKKVRASSVY